MARELMQHKKAISETSEAPSWVETIMEDGGDSYD